jgi:hypothetical protein
MCVLWWRRLTHFRIMCTPGRALSCCLFCVYTRHANGAAEWQDPMEILMAAAGVVVVQKQTSGNDDGLVWSGVCVRRSADAG